MACSGWTRYANAASCWASRVSGGPADPGSDAMEGRTTLLERWAAKRLSRANMQWSLKFKLLKTGALMHRYRSLLTISAVVGLIASLVAQTDGSQFREISMEALRDKV